MWRDSPTPPRDSRKPVAGRNDRNIAYGTVGIDVELNRDEAFKPGFGCAHRVGGFDPNHCDERTIMQESGDSACRSWRRGRIRCEYYPELFAVNRRGRAGRIRLDRLTQDLEALWLVRGYGRLGDSRCKNQRWEPLWITDVDRVHRDQALHQIKQAERHESAGGNGGCVSDNHRESSLWSPPWLYALNFEV